MNSSLIKPKQTAGIEIPIYYVGKHGNNSTGDAKNIGRAFSSYNKAFAEVEAQTPNVSNRFSVCTLDGGIYSGTCNMTNLAYTYLYAPNATISSNVCKIQQTCSMTAHTIKRDSGVGFTLIKEGAGTSHLKLSRLNPETATSGGIFINNGTFYSTIDEFEVVNRTDSLISGDPLNAKTYYGVHKQTKGKIFTTNIGDNYHITTSYADNDFSLNANSEAHLVCDRWNGNIVAGGALSRLYVTCNKRLSDPANDSTLGSVLVTELQNPYIHIFRSANQSVGASTLTDILFDSIDGNAYQLSLNGGTGEVTIKTDGIYEIEAGLALDVSSVGQSREIFVYVNGSVFAKDTERQQGTALNHQNANITTKTPLKKGDLVKIACWSDASPAINANGGAAFKHQTFAKIMKVGNFI
jgi:hypothetical protein